MRRCTTNNLKKNQGSYPSSRTKPVPVEFTLFTAARHVDDVCCLPSSNWLLLRHLLGKRCCCELACNSFPPVHAYAKASVPGPEYCRSLAATSEAGAPKTGSKSQRDWRPAVEQSQKRKSRFCIQSMSQNHSRSFLAHVSFQADGRHMCLMCTVAVLHL